MSKSSKPLHRPGASLFPFTGVWTLCCLLFWYGAAAGKPPGNALPASGARNTGTPLVFVLAEGNVGERDKNIPEEDHIKKNALIQDPAPRKNSDTIIPGNEPETQDPGTLSPDSFASDSPDPDSLVPDTLYCDKVFSDSVSHDSLVCDTTYAPYDSIFREIRGETVQAEHVEDIQEERNRMYFFNFLWDLGEWYDEDDDHVDNAGDGNGDHTLAMVLFVLLGVVVVAVFIVGGAVFLVDKIIHNKRIPYWREFAFAYTYADNSIHPAFEDALSRSTQLAALQFSAGLRGKYLGIGLNTEWGYLDMGFRSITNGLEVLRLQAFYGMAGPLVRLGPTGGFHVDMDFLSGFTSTESLGWLGKAKMTAKLPLGNRLVFGAHLGSLYSGLEPLEGTFIQNYQLNRQFSLLAGAQLGVRF